jgi:hypothetical protein
VSAYWLEPVSNIRLDGLAEHIAALTPAAYQTGGLPVALLLADERPNLEMGSRDIVQFGCRERVTAPLPPPLRLACPRGGISKIGCARMGSARPPSLERYRPAGGHPDSCRHGFS